MPIDLDYNFYIDLLYILFGFSVQEKVDTLTERLERESVIGERTGGNDENDGASTKGGLKSKCEFMHSIFSLMPQGNFNDILRLCWFEARSASLSKLNNLSVKTFWDYRQGAWVEL